MSGSRTHEMKRMLEEAERIRCSVGVDFVEDGLEKSVSGVVRGHRVWLSDDAGYVNVVEITDAGGFSHSIAVDAVTAIGRRR